MVLAPYLINPFKVGKHPKVMSKDRPVDSHLPIAIAFGSKRLPKEFPLHNGNAPFSLRPSLLHLLKVLFVATLHKLLGSPRAEPFNAPRLARNARLE